MVGIESTTFVVFNIVHLVYQTFCFMQLLARGVHVQPIDLGKAYSVYVFLLLRPSNDGGTTFQ